MKAWGVDLERSGEIIGWLVDDRLSTKFCALIRQPSVLNCPTSVIADLALTAPSPPSRASSALIRPLSALYCPTDSITSVAEVDPTTFVLSVEGDSFPAAISQVLGVDDLGV